MDRIINFIIINWIEIIGAFFGLLYLYYEYKADIKMWFTGIIMSVFYTIVFIEASFYAFACINIYYILAGLYGWIKWSKPVEINSNESIDIGLLHTPTRLIFPILISVTMIFVAISYILQTYTNSTVAWADSFITTGSIVAMWMLAQKYVEQWLLLIVINIASVFLYLYQDLYPTSIMYLIYSIVSVFGYLNWTKMIKTNENL